MEIRTGVIGVPAQEKYVSCKFQVVQHDKKCQHAINGGRITKLVIEAGGEVIAHYEEGTWLVEPEGLPAEIAYYILLENYN